MRDGLVLGLLLVTAGCDDLMFGEQPEPPLSTEGYAGVVEICDTYCLGCHSATAVFGQLDLETDPYAAMVDVQASNGQGLLIEPGSPDTSIFYQKITNTQTSGTDMPPGSGGLSVEATDIVKRWIEDGAPRE
jgi:hypothetical protein